MAIMTGGVTTAEQKSLTNLRPRMFWILNRMTQHDGIIVVDHPVEAVITGERFSINVEPTFAGEWYTIEIRYFDPEGNVVYTRELDQRIEVPEEGGDLSGTTNVTISPDRVWVGLEEPVLPFPFWLQAAIGDPDSGTNTGSGDLYIRVE